MCDELKTTSSAAEIQPANACSSALNATNAGPSFVGVAHTSRAKVLRTISGQTAGVDQRRGSFLVLVVGVLALLSVIAVLYATLGSSDRSRAQSVVRKQILDEYPAKVADYISGVIAADALDVILETTPSGAFKFSRESFDYPFTDWRATNQEGTLSEIKTLFTATGGPARRADGTFIGPMPASWTPGDPFLAATEPVFLDAEGGPATLVEDVYKKRRDWAHISNPSPDGRFVNLARLRGVFDRASRSLTSNLTIPGGAGDHPNGLLTGLDPHTPAHFDSRQIGAFRPMFDAYPPSDFRHIHNQWADADGDGFADSRWFEMVDARVPAAGEIDIIPRDSSIRYFVAARIIDLSGLINVNTATDQMAPPDITRLIGSSPAEVDLRSALTKAYQRDINHTSPTGGGSASYDDLYTAPDRGLAPASVEEYLGYDYQQAHSSGHFAYQAIKLSLAAGVPVPPTSPYNVGGVSVGDPFAGLELDASFARIQGLTGPTQRQAWDFDIPLDNTVPVTSAQARHRSYLLRNGATRAAGLQRNAANLNAYLVSNLGIFAEEDQLELLTYHGANDLSVRSALEMVTGGRGTDPANVATYLPQFSPLRDNRQLFNERPERVIGDLSDPALWDQFMLARQIDVRQRLTTLSWSREIRLSANIAPDRLSDAEVRVNPIRLLDYIERKAVIGVADADGHQADYAFSTLLRAYYTSLAPYVSEGNAGPNDANPAWDDASATGASGAFLSYGHQGAEFALITSAIMAANMVDKFDADSIPQARSLIIDHDYRADLSTNDRSQPPDQQLFSFWHGRGGDADLMPGETEDSNTILNPNRNPERLLLASSARNDAINSPAINIFGVEPQVFVTGTTAFTVYTDAPAAARTGPEGAGISLGADDETNSGTTPNEEITIQGDLRANNADLVMRCVAFQLTNPFNVDIQLGANEFTRHDAADNPSGRNFHWLDIGDDEFPAFTRLQDYFYLEFGGRQYALVRLEEQRNRSGPLDANGPFVTGSTPGTYTDISSSSDGVDVVARPIVVPAGETVVVYALSQIPRTILQRMKAVDNAFMTNVVTDPSIVRYPPAGSRYESVSVPRHQSPYEFHKLIRKHIADRGLSSNDLGGIGRPSTVTETDDGRYEQDGVYWIPEFFSPLDASAASPDELGKPGITNGTPNINGSAFRTFKDYSAADGQQWSTLFADLFTPNSTLADNNVVTLWRSIRSGPGAAGSQPTGDGALDPSANLTSVRWDGSGFTPPTGAALLQHNLRNNDLMLDRFRLPAGADFNRFTLLVSGNQVVGGTDALNDDTGFTITLWDSAHRPADTQANTTSAIKSGSLPAYCMERKARDAGGFSWNFRRPDDVADPSSPSLVSLTSGYFVEGGSSAAAGAETEFRKWFDKPNGFATVPGGSPDVVIEAVGRAPSLRRPSGSGDPDGTNGIDTVSRANAAPPFGVEKPDFNLDRPELMVDNTRYGLPGNSDGRDYSQCTLRTADMLSPLAVGAIHDPLAVLPTNWNPADGFVLDDVQWTPLSEAFCLALGYETAPLPDVPCAIRALYPQRLADPTDPASLLTRLYDKAQLKLDQYAAFYDDGDGVFTPDASGTSLEYLRGAQTPLAWNILDTFSTRAGGLQDVTHGAININTASQSVLASLPMVTPPTRVTPPPPPPNIPEDPYLRLDQNGNSRPIWWWQGNLGGPNATRELTTTDLSATIISVRDKMKAYFRPQSTLSFGPTVWFGSGAESNNFLQGLYGALDARSFVGGFQAIGEMPGFRTPGSILMARALAPDAEPSTTQDPAAAGMPHNIDFLGHDRNPAGLFGAPADSSARGVTPGLTRNWDGQWNENQPNLAANDYQEQLAIAGAVVGSTTNRSDVFAVWFIVQGYTKEDVTGLAADEPMVPSVKRRFVMVVDRSNVRQTGDKPKILLMKEVPVD